MTAGDGTQLLDETIDAPITFRSLASTTLALDPPSGTLAQGERVSTEVDFDLDTPRSVRVEVGPMRPADYDDAVNGDWFDVRDVQGQTFGVGTAGTMTGSFTLLESMSGAVDVASVYVSIFDDTTDREIYAARVPADFTFTEPAP